MRKNELELEHIYNERFVARHRLKGRSLTTLGSSKNADILLFGEDVGGVHALIEYRDDSWKIADLGSPKGTLIEKKNIVEETISSPTVVQIGRHTLRITPLESNIELFTKEAQADRGKSDSHSSFFHQIVIRRKGYVAETLLLDANSDYHIQNGSLDKVIKAPKGFEWIKHDFGDLIVQQRLVSSQVNLEFKADKTKEPFDPGLRVAMAISGVVGLILAIFIHLEMSKPSDLSVEKPQDNNFTKMIYDAKTLKSKREQATKATKSIAGASSSVAPSRPQAAEQSPPRRQEISKVGTKVVNNIRAAGLSQLIGKISKRAAVTTTYIEATGKAPDAGASGPAVSVTGTSAIKPGAQVDTKTFKVGGVATSGKAGGSSSYRGVGGLKAGNVGNSSVGVLEEESEVEGGLDKEVIAGVIKSQLGQVRYCYERQLSANPDLYGKVQIKFTIGETGQVISQSIGSSSLNNAMVEGCILRRVSGWRFPVPKGGTAVLVSYPFLFKATN